MKLGSMSDRLFGLILVKEKCGYLATGDVTAQDLVSSMVNHSQRSTEIPLKTWVAHCNCMAGLAESCSHVGAVLCAVETGVRMRDSVTCTMEKSKWLMPTHVNKIPPAPVAEIDFSSAKKKKKET
ncbi:hypothetical protein QZH41_013387 [Actinostola sp. cb2023]|nr:hypothetical protein QZH41_013387 [Actinostola sp. cb2023]